MPQLSPFARRIETWLTQLSHFPWRTTAHTLRQRYRADRLGQTASSLTFTTLLALVPLVAVALAIFTAFPIFNRLQIELQRWLLERLVPDSISLPVLDYLTQFAAQASGLGMVSLSALMLMALELILIIDRTLNNIWRVRRLRPLGQRVLIYWAALTLGPLMLGASLMLTTSAVAAVSRGLGETLPGGTRFLLNVMEAAILAFGMAALYRYVPNTQVQWRHAWAGGIFVSVAMALGKKVLALYLVWVPTWSVLYGTFATLPILLLWVYVAWVIVLLGAVVAAYLPSVLAGVARPAGGPGWMFLLAVEVLQQLHAARSTQAHGMTLDELVQRLRVDVLQLEPVLAALARLDWVAPINADAEADMRYVLLAVPDSTRMEPLVQSLLLERSPSVEGIWQHTGLAQLTLAQVLHH